MALNRTYLFAPGNHARKVEKSLGLDADAVILDLEDAVAISEKPGTRALVVAALAGERRCRGYARVNAFDTPFCYGDLVGIVHPGLDGIVLPKVESAAQLIAVDWVLGQLESERTLPVGGIDLMPIIETGVGVSAATEICRAVPRVKRVAFGAGDYTLDMGMRWTFGERELDHARATIVVASRAAGIEAPVDTVWIHLGEIDALRASTELVRDMGFQGKMCIHPEQVGPANAVFTPTDEDISQAKRYVAAFEAAEAEGSASIQVDGYFIDYPIVDKARRTLELAQELVRD